MSFTDPERAFLNDKSLGHIATTSPQGEPDAPAEAVTDGDTRLIRITAETIWSWGINPDAEAYFAGRIERREVNNP